MSTPLKRWLTTFKITAKERAQLAAGAGMSRNWFSQLVTGHRKVSVQAAARLEAASLELSRVRAGTIPVLSRGELCQVCAECPHYCAVAHKGAAA